MDKLFNYRVLTIIVVIGVCLGLTFLVRSCLGTLEVRATVTPLDVEVGTPVSYSDSTMGAINWVWEFGNGDSSSESKGEYTYTETGKYQIRLTVDDEYEKKFIVNVRPRRTDGELDQLIKIIAPETGLQEEFIIFKGEGDSKEWRWEFGETGVVDAREKTAIYKYTEPGIYEVLLTTEETKYPIRHRIEIAAQYIENDTTNVESLIGNDIRQKLQAIIDQKPFNTNYNYIMNTYLCNNPNTLVIINNIKKNDFYSYCQGLKIIGRKKTIIDNVVIELDEATQSCVQKLIVIQTDIN